MALWQRSQGRGYLTARLLVATTVLGLALAVLLLSARTGVPVQAVKKALNGPEASVPTVGEPTLSIAVIDVSIIETQPAATVMVELMVAGAGQVSIDVATSDGTAIAGLDYLATSSTLVWPAGDSGFRTFTVPMIDDAVEEDAETVIIQLTNASSTGSGTVAIVDATAVLTINDDEPAAKIVTITSEAEAIPGDQYFLAIAAADSAALGLQHLQSVTSIGLLPQMLVPIDQVPEILVKMHRLADVRSKSTTHVSLGTLPENQPLGGAGFVVEFGYEVGGTTTVSTTLDVVGERSNRNYFLFPGFNYIGLGLMPDDPTIATLLRQPATEAGPGLGAALGRTVELADVVETIFSFRSSGADGWITFSSGEPCRQCGPGKRRTDATGTLPGHAGQDPRERSYFYGGGPCRCFPDHIGTRVRDHVRTNQDDHPRVLLVNR